MVLQGENGRIRIRYTFAANGAVTVLGRELEYEPDDFRESVDDPVRLEELMYTQSQVALGKLKHLVEPMLSGTVAK